MPPRPKLEGGERKVQQRRWCGVDGTMLRRDSSRSQAARNDQREAKRPGETEAKETPNLSVELKARPTTTALTEQTKQSDEGREEREERGRE